MAQATLEFFAYCSLESGLESQMRLPNIYDYATPIASTTNIKVSFGPIGPPPAAP